MGVEVETISPGDGKRIYSPMCALMTVGGAGVVGAR